MAARIQIRRDTAANWTSANPVLSLGEPALETDTGKIKHGDGATAWNSLAYTWNLSSGSSVLASRPGAGSVPGGYLYFATDDNGGTVYRSDGVSTWTKAAASVLQSGGAELGYAEITSTVPFATLANNTFTDVTGLTTTVTVGARPVFVQVFVPEITVGVASASVTVAVIEDGSVVNVGSANIAAAANLGIIGIAQARRTPAAGSHTYKVQVKHQAGSTTNMAVIAGSVDPAFIRVVEG